MAAEAGLKAPTFIRLHTNDFMTVVFDKMLTIQKNVDAQLRFF